MEARVPGRDSFGALVGRQLAGKLVDMARSGATIVDNSPVVQHLDGRKLDDVLAVLDPVVQADDRIRRFRLSRPLPPAHR